MTSGSGGAPSGWTSARSEPVAWSVSVGPVQVEDLITECNGYKAGLAYWNRRYVETARQAEVDLAARDRARAERDAALVQSEELIAAYATLEGELAQARVALNKVRRVLVEAGIVRLGDTEDDES